MKQINFSERKMIEKMLKQGTDHGWGEGIRTPECCLQRAMPYHLATPH